MSYIFDSTPLIYLCKSGLNWIFHELDDECIIPESVFNEVVIKGKDMGKADALITEELVKNGIITVLQADRAFDTVSCTLNSIKEKLMCYPLQMV